MQKEWLETVLQVPSSTLNSREEVQETLCEFAETPSIPQQIDGVVIGSLVGFNEAGEPLVDFPAKDSGEVLVARTTQVLGQQEIGREAVLMFEGNNPGKPIIMGLLQPSPVEAAQQKLQNAVVAEVDGERLEFKAKKEIVLRCGKASITLTRAGKILIRGAYLLSRSSGVNRIKGGSIQLN